MNLKRALKVVTLYELIESNKTVICYILYHSLIIFMNYISCKHLDKFKEEFPDGYYQFSLIHNNINTCQLFTVWSLLVIIFSPIIQKLKKSIDTEKINKIRIAICISFVIIKYTYAIYEYNVYDREWLQNTRETHISDVFSSTSYNIIEFQYVIGMILTGATIYTAVATIILTSILVGIYSLYLLIKFLLETFNEWAKTVSCSYVEYSIETSVEEV
jgi:hypothetical protein